MHCLKLLMTDRKKMFVYRGILKQTIYAKPSLMILGLDVAPKEDAQI